MSPFLPSFSDPQGLPPSPSCGYLPAWDLHCYLLMHLLPPLGQEGRLELRPLPVPGACEPLPWLYRNIESHGGKELTVHWLNFPPNAGVLFNIPNILPFVWHVGGT